MWKVRIETNYELASAIRACNGLDAGCPLAAHRLATGEYAVPAEVGVRYERGGIAVIAEAPGANEAATSRPLVGSAGKLFEGLLSDAGLTRDELVLMNRVRCRPPGNRLASAPGAVEACDEWTVVEITEYQPSVVIVMGATALASVFGTQAKVGLTRGSVRATGEAHPYGHRTWIATYHPASLLPNRYPQNRPLVIADLITARELLASIPR